MYTMKKLTCLFLFLSCLGTRLLYAETYDVIVLQDQTQIVCTITDITETMVSYTRNDRPKTITFSTPMEKIEQIIFSDGTIAHITADSTSTQPSQPEPTTTTPIEEPTTSTQYTTIQTSDTQTATTQPATSVTNKRIYRDKHEYMYNDTYISEKEVENLISKNYAANEKWQKAKREITAGWIVTSIGGVCVIGSMACIPAGSTVVLSLCLGGLACSSVGLGLALGCAKNFDKAIDIYNAQLNTTTELHLYADPNGVGLALRF